MIKLYWCDASQEIICFDAALITLMIIHMVSYFQSYITAGYTDHRHRLNHSAYIQYFMKENIEVKDP